MRQLHTSVGGAGQQGGSGQSGGGDLHALGACGVTKQRSGISWEANTRSLPVEPCRPLQRLRRRMDAPPLHCDPVSKRGAGPEIQHGVPRTDASTRTHARRDAERVATFCMHDIVVVRALLDKCGGGGAAIDPQGGVRQSVGTGSCAPTNSSENGLGLPRCVMWLPQEEEPTYI